MIKQAGENCIHTFIRGTPYENEQGHQEHMPEIVCIKGEIWTQSDYLSVGNNLADLRRQYEYIKRDLKYGVWCVLSTSCSRENPWQLLKVLASHLGLMYNTNEKDVNKSAPKIKTS